MNLAFILLVILGLIVLWFLLSFAFVPIGKFIHKIYQNAVDELNKEDIKNEENKEDN